ncbi:DUF4062 domain-containing protein [uncultured Oscillibacter sp.]|uniref:DUF4062 domain-containing protein n=1 Tax=uncultured Oscillibacter sp. TaxID=876091 RepID=UPI00216DDFAE|nr:DUF4062 domain-containing protein [uncultured Oscillibacter sp.]MCI9299641.1 DUF4062 domain-containing protein [Oscillibacter sp.]MCI9462193.1 DUF4062 domain-containing protein [Oscillibacter sp.]
MATTQERMNVPIFVSSTYEDLKAYRDEVERSIIYMNQTIKGMEFFGSTPERPLDKCLQTVRECKLYIGIIGMRYGSVEEDSGKSFTELEYDEAVKNRIPVLIYILDENHPIASRFVDKGEGAEKLEAFKTRLKKAHVVSSFTTPADLGKKVTQDLMNELKKDRAIEDSLRTLPSDTEGGDYEILRGFLRRPYKYYGQEIILDMLLTPNQTSSVKVALCKGLGLQVGDVSGIRATAKSPDGKESSSIQLFGEGEMADWIDSVREPRSARLKGRLSYCVLKEDTKHDDGVILKDFMYTRMILLDVIEDSLPE